MKNTFKKKIFSYIVFLLILSIFASIYALLIYFNKANSNVGSFNAITFIMGVLAFFILGLLSGNSAQKNGLLEGLIAALIIILITLIINFFVQVPFIGRSFVKTVSYITAASLGGILGVNFRPIFGRNDD